LPITASKLSGLFFSSLIDQLRKSVFFISACEKSRRVTFLDLTASSALNSIPIKPTLLNPPTFLSASKNMK